MLGRRRPRRPAGADPQPTRPTALRWEAAAEEIHADICANGLDGRGVFVQHYETEALDASVLLMPLVRFLPPDDQRIRDTVLAIADELTEDGLVLRYRVDETDDGFAGEEGTFTICSFWLVSALVEIGELARARGAVREAALVREPARAVCRADRPAHRPSPRQLPAGLHASGADQRGRAHHHAPSGSSSYARWLESPSWTAPGAGGEAPPKPPRSQKTPPPH